MLSRWIVGIAAVAVALVACVLVALDVTDTGSRRWWDDHALTTSIVAGLLKSASTPLLQNLTPEMRSAVRGDDPA